LFGINKGSVLKNLILLLSSKEFIPHAQALIGALRSIGNWAGDIGLLAAYFSPEDVADFERAGIKIFPAVGKMGAWTRVQIFSDMVQPWDRVLAIDLDFLIFKDVNTLFEQEGKILAEEQPFDFTNQFDIKCDTVAGDLLAKEVTITDKTFCFGGLRFDTSIITSDFQARFAILREKYHSINHINGIIGGAEQPILNIIFYKQWKKLIGSNFIGSKTDETIISHTTNWYAPWIPTGTYHQQYLDGLKLYNDNILKS
jgi:hypothetical protein